MSETTETKSETIELPPKKPEPKPERDVRSMAKKKLENQIDLQKIEITNYELPFYKRLSFRGVLLPVLGTAITVIASMVAEHTKNEIHEEKMLNRQKQERRDYEKATLENRDSALVLREIELRLESARLGDLENLEQVNRTLTEAVKNWKIASSNSPKDAQQLKDTISRQNKNYKELVVNMQSLERTNAQSIEALKDKNETLTADNTSLLSEVNFLNEKNMREVVDCNVDNVDFVLYKAYSTNKSPDDLSEQDQIANREFCWDQRPRIKPQDKFWIADKKGLIIDGKILACRCEDSP